MRPTRFHWLRLIALSTPLAAPAALAQTPPMPPVQQTGATTQAQPNVAATVNGEIIRLDQVDAFIKKQPAPPGVLTTSQTRQLRLDVASDMIEDVLMKQFLKQHGPKIEPIEVDKLFKGLVESLRKQNKTAADYYRETGQTEVQVRESWLTLLQFSKYVEQRATEAELRKFYDTNKDFFDRVGVKAYHIVLRVSPNGQPGERVEARAKLTEIRSAILNGKITFADAAKKYSICPTAPHGGEIGMIARRDTLVEEAFARKAFSLPIGEISEPTDTDFGVHLIKITERKPGTPSTFEKSLDLVRDCYSDDVRQTLVTHLRKQSTITITVP